jgi:hypothetical protein
MGFLSGDDVCSLGGGINGKLEAKSLLASLAFAYMIIKLV